MPSTRSPDYFLKALDKSTNEKAKVGAAWVNEDWSISIVLNPFVVLPNSSQLVLTLFPNDKKYDSTS